MVAKEICEIARRIKDSQYGFSIDKIVLYGSHARSTQNNSSDIDLAVLIDEDSPYPLLDDEGWPEGIFDYIKGLPSQKRIHAVLYTLSEMRERIRSIKRQKDKLQFENDPLWNIHREGITLARDNWRA